MNKTITISLLISLFILISFHKIKKIKNYFINPPLTIPSNSNTPISKSKVSLKKNEIQTNFGKTIFVDKL